MGSRSLILIALLMTSASAAAASDDDRGVSITAAAVSADQHTVLITGITFGPSPTVALGGVALTNPVVNATARRSPRRCLRSRLARIC